MEYAACSVPVAPVRRKASHKEEMVSQLLFGEMMQVLKIKNGEWAKVRCTLDKYEGWVRINQLEPVDQATAAMLSAWVAAEWVNPLMVNETVMKVPIGASLPGYYEQEGRFGNFSYQFWENAYRRDEIVAQSSMVNDLVQPWLHAPYLWGGRSPLGVDCSGFTQVVFKMMGIDLWRDAYLQAEQGIAINELEDAHTGDLAFFNDKKGRITHVGVLLGNHSIIHASGKVRIDNITEEGIIHADTGQQTHVLKSIRRHW